MYKKCEEILKELESEGKLKVWWNFKFPEKEPLKIVLKDLLEKEVDERYYLNDKQLISLKNSICARDFKDPKCIQIGKLDITGNDSIKRVYSPEGISPTLTTCDGGNRQAKIKDGNNIRKLVPLEYWRLMSFDDEDFYKAQSTGNSNSQLYKQARELNCSKGFRKNIQKSIDFKLSLCYNINVKQIRDKMNKTFHKRSI